MSCPVCGRAADQQVIGEWETGHRLLRCGVCGVGHADPFAAADQEWYARFKIYEAGFDEKYPLEWRHKKFLSLMPPPRAGAQLLDVGCGTGTFLKAASDRGYVVQGLDFEPERAAFGARVFGVPIDVATLHQHLSRGNSGRYDVVTCFEIVEHLDDPVGFLKQVKTALKREGQLAVSMPNWNRPFQLSAQIGDFPPHHLTWWTKQTLHDFLARNGFSQVRVYEEPFDLRRVLFLRIHTGLGQLTSAAAGRIIRSDKARAQVVVGRVTRIAKESILSLAHPVGGLLGKTLGWKGIGLFAIATNAGAQS